MKYFSQTGNYIIANQTTSTSGTSQENLVKFIKTPVIVTTKKAFFSSDHEKEEFTKEQEKTFYKKVFKTSLA